MRKFKLIKEYPGSPKLGCIWDWRIKYDIAEYPEFWEEVVEKDYEILSISTNSYFGITTSKLDIEAYLKCPKSINKWSIHSVKRLSDGEIFTVGDKVVHNFCKEAKIEKIYFIEPNRLTIYVSKGWNVSISNIEHIKQPLFTTEDGVDIFEGDKYCSVWKDDLTFQGTFTAEKVNLGKFTNPETMMVFSTKQTAEEYILMNKPYLSINDINNSWAFQWVANKGKFVHGSKTLENLKELVKQRL